MTPDEKRSYEFLLHIKYLVDIEHKYGFLDYGDIQEVISNEIRGLKYSVGERIIDKHCHEQKNLGE